MTENEIKSIIQKQHHYFHTGVLLQKIIQDCFEDRHVGKEVMKKAAEHLTPVTLELREKVPVSWKKAQISGWPDLSMRYRPYKASHDKMIRFFLK